MKMVSQQEYGEIVEAWNRFREDRRLEPLERLVPQARLYDYGFRSLIGPLEVTRTRVLEAYEKSSDEERWHLRLILGQLDELDMLTQLQVSNDFRAISVHFAFYHTALGSLRESLEKVREVSRQGLRPVLDNLDQAIESVANSNGLYVANWKEPQEWRTQYFPDVGLRVIKLIYANWHSLNLAIIPRGFGPHKHASTSEIHFSLDRTDGDQIARGYRLHVTEPYAVPIKPNEWHGYDEHRSPIPHQLLFLTGSRQILGWGIVNDRSVTESSKLELTAIGSEEIAKAGGILLDRATKELGDQVSNSAVEKRLISSSATDGIDLSAVAIPDIWRNYSEDIIHTVVKGTGELRVLNNTTTVDEGDAFAVPFQMEYELKNRGRQPLVLLGSTLKAKEH
jgi:mannose-6-phosphate isomerase-like protein (cupin superfamily)